MRRISVNYLLLTLGVLLNFSSANASTIVPLQEDVSFTSSEANEFVTSGDLLTLHAVNAAGISYNEFSTFSVSGPTLKLINIPTFDNDSNRVEAPNLIVIKADNISLNGRIELAGAPADILFISNTSNGVVSCTDCELARFSRATLAVATASNTLDDTMTAVGELQTQASGVVSINNLDAPGIYHLEILANTFNNSSTVDINLPINDQRQPDLNGDLTLGAGGIDVYLGDMKWNYESQSITGLTATDTLQEISANLNGVGIKVSTSGQLNVTGNLNTKVDVLAASVYKGEDRLPVENITLQAFGASEITSGSTTTAASNATSFLEGNLVTSGNLLVRVNSGLELKLGSSQISADYQEYAITGNLYNYRDLFAHNIKIAAKNIINQATIEVGSKLEAFAEKNLVNHFGGKLLGDVIALQTSTGFVRNGSRTPYLSTTENESLLSYYSDDLILKASETSEMGAFYHSGIDVNVIGGYVQPSNTSAHISSRILTIKSKAFENINPYWEQVSELGIAVLDRKLSTQVTVVAQELIAIKTESGWAKNGYIVNSSAIMQLIGENGVLKLETDYVINQRYRNLILLDYDVLNFAGDEWGLIGPTTMENIWTRAYTYSPPGILLSMGDSWISAVNGFVNETAYFEVYGDAQFYASGIYDWGIEHSGITKSVGGLPSFSCFFQPSGSYFEPIEEGADCLDGFAVNDTRSSPSLFLINGDIVTGPRFTSATLNSWTGAMDVAVEEIIDSYDHEWPDWWYEDHPCNQYACISEFFVDNSDYVTNEDTLTVNWDQTATVAYPFGLGIVTDSYTNTETFSLIDVMVDLYYSMVDTISDLISEFNWWGE